MYSRYYLQILKISRLFLNTLSADDKYSLLNRENLTQPIQIQFSQKEIIFSLIFLCICEIYIKFWTFSKIKDDTDSWCILRKYGNAKTWLHNCVKTPISEDPSTSNMVNGPKHCWNMKDSTFTISIDHWEGNWVGKYLS